MTVRLPWRCPDCGVMHAPHVDSCDCTGRVVSVPYVQPIAPQPAPYEWRWPNWPNPYVGDVPGWLQNPKVTWTTTTSTTEPTKNWIVKAQ